MLWIRQKWITGFSGYFVLICSTARIYLYTKCKITMVMMNNVAPKLILDSLEPTEAASIWKL